MRAHVAVAVSSFRYRSRDRHLSIQVLSQFDVDRLVGDDESEFAPGTHQVQDFGAALPSPLVA